MNLDQLQALRAIADEGSFEAAAYELGVSASAVSQRIRALVARIAGMALHPFPAHLMPGRRLDQLAGRLGNLGTAVMNHLHPPFDNPAVRRALLRAGVPVALNPTDLVLGEQRIVSALLLGVRALYEELQPTEWRDLLLSPVGGADPVTLRRLLRGLRRWSPEVRAEESLRELLNRRPLPGGAPAGL